MSQRAPDDAALRSLRRSFELLSECRRATDQSGDDIQRADADAEWLICCRRIIALRASTPTTLRLKARVLLALIEATGVEGRPEIDAAKSLARDLAGGDI